jgi:hypothetical protein
MAPAPPARRALTAVAVVALVALASRVDWLGDDLVDLDERVEANEPRDLTPYEGLGTWVDAFDYGPDYQLDGHTPAVTPDDVDDMAAAGVGTLFIQATRQDPRSPDGFVDEDLLGQFVVAAHEAGLQVVGWYLPTFAHPNADLRNLTHLLEFEADGHRLDGVAVDIELTEDVPDTVVRNQRLLRLSQRLRSAAGDDALGAIVLPPVLTEVVNPDLWPAFPWTDLEPYYDVWLPMSYWTLRAPDSGYQNGASYHNDSVQRLRVDLEASDAPVHGIGGVGDEVTPTDLRAFVATLRRTGAVGGSVYDWATLSDENRTVLEDAFTHLFPSG